MALAGVITPSAHKRLATETTDMKNRARAVVFTELLRSRLAPESYAKAGDKKK